MTNLLPLVCLAIGFAIPVVAIALVARRARRQLTTSDAYRAVSRHLGLAVDTRGMSLTGYIDDRRIWVGTLLVGHGESRSTTCEAIVGYQFPLGLGLTAQPTRRRPGQAKRDPTPYPNISKRLALATRDPAILEPLLAHGLGDALDAFLAAWPRVTLTDRAIRVHLDRPEATEERLSSLVSQLQELARHLEASRLALGSLGDPAHWTDLAGEFGFELEPSLPMLTGDLEGLPVRVVAEPTSSGHSVWIYVRAPQHTDLGLHVLPQTAPDGYGSVGQDITTGEGTFDTSFVIKGWDPSRVQALLTPEVRRDLIALDDLGSVSLDDYRVTLRGASAEPSALREALLTSVRIVRSIRWSS